MYSREEDSKYWEQHEEFQQELHTYLNNRNVEFGCAVRFSSGIDCVAVITTPNDEVILWVGLPPVSNYTIRETEQTHKYLKKIAKTA